MSSSKSEVRSKNELEFDRLRQRLIEAQRLAADNRNRMNKLSEPSTELKQDSEVLDKFIGVGDSIVQGKKRLDSEDLAILQDLIIEIIDRNTEDEVPPEEDFPVAGHGRGPGEAAPRPTPPQSRTPAAPNTGSPTRIPGVRGGEREAPDASARAKGPGKPGPS